MSGHILILLSYIYNQHEYIPDILILWLLCTSDFALQTVRGAQAEILEFKCLKPPIVTRMFLKRKADMSPKTLTCDLDSQVHCLPAVFL